MNIYYKITLNEEELILLITAMYWYRGYYIKSNEDINIDDYGDKIAKLHSKLISLM